MPYHKMFMKIFSGPKADHHLGTEASLFERTTSVLQLCGCQIYFKDTVPISMRYNGLNNHLGGNPIHTFLGV